MKAGGIGLVPPSPLDYPGVKAATTVSRAPAADSPKGQRPRAGFKLWAQIRHESSQRGSRACVVQVGLVAGVLAAVGLTFSFIFLSMQGSRRADGTAPREPRLVRALDAVMVGALLVGLSTFQGEFDFGVPQFRLVWQPILLALAAGIGLVAARVRIGRGGAVTAALVFVACVAASASWRRLDAPRV